MIPHGYVSINFFLCNFVPVLCNWLVVDVQLPNSRCATFSLSMDVQFSMMTPHLKLPTIKWDVQLCLLSPANRLVVDVQLFSSSWKCNFYCLLPRPTAKQWMCNFENCPSQLPNSRCATFPRTRGCVVFIASTPSHPPQLVRCASWGSHL